MLPPFPGWRRLSPEIYFRPTKMKKRDANYNSTKKRALEIFEDQKWMDVPTVARKVGIRPVRRAYTYLAHLEDLGLLMRGWDDHHKLHFRITARGLERLQWLRSQKGPSMLEEVFAPL